MLPIRARALLLTTAFALTSLSAPVLAQEAGSPAPEPSGSPAPSESPLAEATLTPSGVTAAELSALLPKEIAGLAVSGSSFEAASILSGVESDALLQDMADLALAYETELDRFAIAGGGAVEGDAFVSVIGGWLPGVPAAELQEAFVSIVLGPTDPELTGPGTVAGQEVTVIRADPDAGPADTAYLIPVGEVVWLVIADEDTLPAAIGAVAAE